MNPITHGLIGWTVASIAPIGKRERGLVVLGAIVADLDGLGIVVDYLAQVGQNPTAYWEQLHHVVGHNIAAAVIFTALAFVFSRRDRMVTAFLVFVSFHLHLLGDLTGARGPDGNQWPIPYLLPFSSSMQWAWSGQWALNAWQNFVITISLLVFLLYTAWRHGLSPLEFISAKLNRGFVAALRQRFGEPAGSQKMRVWPDQ